MHSFKIFFVTKSFLPTVGGTEMYLFHLCRQLQLKDIYCKVFCEGDVKDYEFYFYENVPVQLCPSSKKGSVLQGLFTAKFIEGFDALHIHSFDEQIDNNFLKKLNGLGVPLFFTPHLANNFCNKNNGSLMFKGKHECNGVVNQVKCQVCTFSGYKTLPFLYRTTIFHVLIHKLLPKVIARKFFSKEHFLASEKLERIELLNKHNVKTIALSEWYMKLLMNNNLKNVTLIKQGVADHFLSKNEQNKGVKDIQAVKWIYIGRMSEEKGIKELIATFSNTSLTDDTLTIITLKPEVKDKYYEEVSNMISANRKISIYFNQSSLQVSNLLVKADCLVLPSKITEMASLVIQEALAKKKPVLVSEYIRDEIENNNLGIKFSFAKGNFASKMKDMRARIMIGAYNTVNKAMLLSFEDVAEKHIEEYKITN